MPTRSCFSGHPRIRLVELALLGAIGCMATALCGCCCEQIGMWKKHARQYSNEFIESGYDDVPPSRWIGSYAGLIEREGRAYREYRFKEILDGDPSRQIVILVEQKKGREPRHVIVTESSDVVDQVEPAELYLLWDFKVVLAAMPKNKSLYDALVVMKRRHPQFLKLGEHSPHQLIASFAESSFSPAVFSLPLGSQGDEPGWEFAIADIGLEWDVRSRTGYCLLHLNYLWAVPVDIVATPLILLVMWARGYKG